MAKPLDQLMQKDMTRKEFLLTLSLGVVSIFGFGRIIELLTGHSLHKNISAHSELGYNSGDYGGKTESTKQGLT
jgi:hypothetical protein